MTAYLQQRRKVQNTKQVSQRTPAFGYYPTLNKDDLKLSDKGLSPAQQENAWKKVYNYLHAYKSTMIGYQVNENLHCTAVLKDYLDFHINNCGDPFIGGNYHVNTKLMECAVLDYFAKLWNIKLPELENSEDQNESYWGYVVSMGCTEANLYALYNARDYLSGKPLIHSDHEANCKKNHCYADTGPLCQSTMTNPNAFTPVAFYSEDAHYCQAKAMQVLRIKTFYELGSGQFPCPLIYPDDYPTSYSADFLGQNGWPCLVPVGEDGSMHLPSLVKLVSAFVSRGYPPIVIFTSGATFKGNYENPQAAISELVPILRQNNLYERNIYYSSEDPSKFDRRYGFWFHVDGALGAAHLPFVEIAMNQGLLDDKFPNGFPVFDFRISEVMSIAMSLHKWFGCPFPSGIYMTRKKNQLQPPTNPLYIGCGDTTFAGSRNGHAVLTLWDFLSKNSHQELAERAVRGQKMTKFAYKKLQELEKELGIDLWLSRSPGSLFICFKQPREDIVHKYSLACNTLLVKTTQGKLERRLYCHLCVMPHVNKELIEDFIKALKMPGSFPLQDTYTV